MLAQFKQYLGAKGITPTKEVEEQITFLLDGLYYLFVYESSDQNYFRLLLPNIYSIEEDSAKKDRCDEIINNFNYTYKVVKAIVTSQNQIWLSVEQFVYSDENIDMLFERCVMLLKATIELFQKKINEADSERNA